MSDSNLVSCSLSMTVAARTALLHALKLALDVSENRIDMLESANTDAFIRSNYLELLDLRAYRRHLYSVLNQLWSKPYARDADEMWSQGEPPGQLVA